MALANSGTGGSDAHERRACGWSIIQSSGYRLMDKMMRQNIEIEQRSAPCGRHPGEEAV
jgi:hypothetical protein